MEKLEKGRFFFENWLFKKIGKSWRNFYDLDPDPYPHQSEFDPKHSLLLSAVKQGNYYIFTLELNPELNTNYKTKSNIGNIFLIFLENILVFEDSVSGVKVKTFNFFIIVKKMFQCIFFSLLSLWLLFW